MSTSHIDRKELKRPDAFVEKATDVISFFNDNQAKILATLAFVLAVGMAIGFYSNFKTKRSHEAYSAVFNAKKVLIDQLHAKPQSPNWEAEAKTGIDQLEAAAEKYRGSAAAYDARLYLGDLYFDHANPAKASEQYKKAVDSATSRTEKTFAQHSLAYAYENQKQYDAAIDALRQVLAANDKALKADAMIGLARLYELKGEAVKAKEQYEQVIREFPNSTVSKTATIQKQNLH